MNEKDFFNSGKKCYELKQYEKAVEHYCKAIELDPNCEQAYDNFREIYLYLCKYDDFESNQRAEIENDLIFGSQLGDEIAALFEW